MSSLLQSTGSSPYVLVHIVGPLAATVPSLTKPVALKVVDIDPQGSVGPSKGSINNQGSNRGH